MAEIISIIAETNYLHISFSGPYEHLQKIELHAETVRQAVEEHKCSNLLLNFCMTGDLDKLTIIDEHDLAEFIQKSGSIKYRVAILFPALSNYPGVMIGKHLENVAVNRGVALHVFWQLADAISWISRTNGNSKEVTPDEQLKTSG